MDEQIQSCEALVEMSQGHWEGCHRSDIYTPETQSLMERFQPDFSAPAGESLRQVEFRMVQFLNSTILALPEKLRSDFSPPYQNENQGNSNAFTNSFHERDGSSSLPQAAHWDLLHRHKQGGLAKKKSGKSRLQIVTTTGGGQEADDEMSPREPMSQGPLRETTTSVRSGSSSSASSCIGVFTHSVPTKCLLTGILGCSATMSNKICIEDSSVTVLQHSWKTGWQIKRLNDTSHLRLL